MTTTSLFSRGARRLIGGILIAAASLSFTHNAAATVKVGVSDWTGFAAWYVAEKNGYFKKYGADVKLIWFGNYSDSIAALSAGQLDANGQTWSDTLVPMSKGIPVKAILVNDNSAGNDALVVGPKIKSWADLKNKTIALEQFSVSHFFVVNALARNGLSINDVKIQNLSAADAAVALIAGRVDAAATWNPWIDKIQDSGKGRALFTSREMPGLIPDMLVARTEAIKTKRKDLVGMIRAWYDAVEFIRAHPDDAAKIMAATVQMDPVAYKRLLAGTKFFDEKSNLEAFNPAEKLSLIAVAPTIYDFLAKNKLIQSKPTFENGVDASLVTEASKLTLAQKAK